MTLLARGRLQEHLVTAITQVFAQAIEFIATELFSVENRNGTQTRRRRLAGTSSCLRKLHRKTFVRFEVVT